MFDKHSGRKPLIACQIEDDVFQTVVWVMETPGKPRVTIVSDYFIGSAEYFYRLGKLLGHSTPDVWVGYQSLRDTDLSGTTRKMRSRIEVFERDLALRNKLARQVDLLAKRECLQDIGGTNMDITKVEFVADWNLQRSLAQRLSNRLTQQIITLSQTGKDPHAERCRTHVLGMYERRALLMATPVLVESIIQSDDPRIQRFYGYMSGQLNEGQEVRVLVGGTHAMAIRRQLEATGYQVVSQTWQDCADLKPLRC